MTQKPLIASLLIIFTISSVEAQQSSKNRALHNAVRDWNLSHVKRAIRRGANINSRNTSGFTPLFSAAPARDEGRLGISRLTSITRYLLKRRAKPNLTNKYGDTALHHCIKIDCVLTYVKLLVRAKANVNATNKKGDTILALAIKRRRRDIISYLKSKGAKATTDTSKLPNNVYDAVKLGDFSNLKKLIQKGADVNKPFIDNARQKHFALGLAVSTGNIKITKYLLQKGAKDNLADLLYLSVNNAQIEMAKVLIKAGAKVNKSGRPAIFAALYPRNRRPGHFKILKWLIKSGSDVNEIHAHKGHLLDVAAIATNRIPAPYINYLLDHGAHPDGQSHGLHLSDQKIPFDKRSPLEKTVAWGGSSSLALILIRRGANINIHNNFVLKTLAGGPATLSVLRALHKKGVNLRIKTKSGKTMIHLAAGKDASVKFLRYLVRAKVNWRARDNKGRTAMYYAKKRQNRGARAAIRYLRRLGLR